MHPAPWVDRTFRFDMALGIYPEVLERLRGTPARLEEKVRGIPHALLTRRNGNGWSIQEHAGHLADLDELHAARLEDYRAGVAILRAADMTNRRTYEANHNARPSDEILEEFRRERLRLVQRLEAWPEDRIAQTALHPRLRQPMRVLDMAFFVAEHDDHHLAVMTTLARKLG